MTRAIPRSVTPAAGVAPQLRDRLQGTWRLRSFTQKILDTGETIDVFGKSPQGFINYSTDGRMIVLMVGDARPRASDLSQLTDAERAELFKTMVAYAGTYTVDDAEVTHHLDISWNQIFTGADQVRNIELTDGVFVMSTNPQPRSQDGRLAVSVMTWEKLP
jgi:hypothetical protein